MPACTYKFGDFELDPSRFELRKNGRVLKLERIPMDLLILLAEKEGSVATRQEIIARLWGKDVFVDTEHGINTAVRKIRLALREDAERPRFVQTVPGKGYRLVAEVGNADAIAAIPTVPQPAAVPLAQAASPPSDIKRSRESGTYYSIVVTAVICALVVVAGTVAFNAGGLRDRISSKHQIAPIHSIAVLPLANLSGDPSQDYYAEGLTDELITAVARNRSLRVVSRTSAMQYRNASQPLTKIAQALGVDGILEGSVNRGTDHVHINLQLIDARTDTHVWAQSYDRDLHNALLLPGELSETIAREAKVSSAPAQQQRSVNPEAHDAYLHGRYLWIAGNYSESLKYFEKAIQLQPDYAPGWSGLSMNILGPGDAISGEVVDKAEAAARKAIELDDSLAEGHHALAGMYFFGKWDWERADAESRRSLELDPNFSEAYHLHSYIFFAMNRVPEAMQEQKRATEIDPFLRPWALGRAYYRVRQYDAALEEFRMRASADSATRWVHGFLSKVYGFKGMDKESVRELEEDTRINQGGKAAGEIDRAYQRGGRKAVLQLRLNNLRTLSRKEYVSSFDLAEAYADLGMKEEALQELEDAYRQHAKSLVFLQQEPDFDSLHSDDRYRGLVRKIGLVPAY